MHGACAASDCYQVLIQAFCITGDHHQQSEHLHRGAIQVGWWPPAEKKALLCMADSCCTTQMSLRLGLLPAWHRLCHCMESPAQASLSAQGACKCASSRPSQG